MSELPRGWAMASIGEIGTWRGGGTPSKANSSFWTGGDIPWVSPKDMKRPIIDDAEERITVAAVEGSATQLVPEGSVLIVTRSGILRHSLPVAVNMREVAINQDLKAFSPWGRIDPIFISWQLRSQASEILSLCAKSGTTVDSVDFDRFKAFQIRLPPLPEQRRIVAKIDSLSAKSRRARDHLDHIPRLVEKYKQSILAAAFRGELTREWRTMRQLSDPRPRRLRDVLAAPIRNGLSVRGSDSPPGVRSLRLSALRGGTVDTSDVRYLPISDDQAQRFFLKQGDVLVSRGNGTKAFVGLAALVVTLPEPTIFPDTAFRLRLQCDAVRPAWLARIWNAEPVRGQIEQAAKTTAGIWKISQRDLDQLDLLFPIVEEQDEIVRRIEIAFAWIDRLSGEAGNARKLINHLDQAVLAKAFRGELVSQDPNDEPASVLLERIGAEREMAESTKRGRAANTGIKSPLTLKNEP